MAQTVALPVNVPKCHVGIVMYDRPRAGQSTHLPEAVALTVMAHNFGLKPPGK
ncbi:hypothetical protein J6590_048148 [Homalodisca vitripennis]|nr:hypothetical protein J6590_048148 [Homalodisca vitripennis]